MEWSYRMTTDNLATRCDMRHGEQNVPNEQEEAER